MKIRPSRIYARLQTQGFILHRTNGTVPSFGFVRLDRIPGLYQQVIVCFAGRNSEVAFAYVGLSTIKWFQFRNRLSDDRLLSEIAQNQERGWTEIKDDADAKVWEESLVQVAPVKLREFADQAREGLLTRTESIRQGALTLLERLNQLQTMAEQIETLRRRMPSELFAEAERLAGAIGVMQLRGTEDAYLLACLTILSAEDGGRFVGQQPLMNDELMWQIQLVADGILSWDSNKTLLEV